MSTYGIQREPCCVFPADGKTVTKDLFELKAVADGVYTAIAAVILTNDGVVMVDSHSKPSAARALFQEIQGVTRQPVRKLINTHFHWDHWQGNEVYAASSSERIGRTKALLAPPPAAHPPALLVSGRLLRTLRHVPPARCGSPRWSGAQQGAARPSAAWTGGA
jgi:glyoxylase-like metal-dependent hydrolase (beta-lactamase superfamily II)